MCAALSLVVCSSAATPPEPIVTNVSFDTGRTVEVLTSRPLRGSQPGVYTAVIVMHGLGRKAMINCRRVAKAMRMAGVEGLVLAPWFKNRSDSPGTGEHFWKKSGWVQGNLSRDSRHSSARISSFAVVDRLYAELTMPGRFPGLRRIVLAGHSAGAPSPSRPTAR